MYGMDPAYHLDVSCPSCHTVFNCAFTNDTEAVFCPNCDMECAYEVKIILHSRSELIGGLTFTPEQTRELFDKQRELRADPVRLVAKEIKKLDEQMMNKEACYPTDAEMEELDKQKAENEKA